MKYSSVWRDIRGLQDEVPGLGSAVEHWAPADLRHVPLSAAEPPGGAPRYSSLRFRDGRGGGVPLHQHYPPYRHILRHIRDQQ